MDRRDDTQLKLTGKQVEILHDAAAFVHWLLWTGQPQWLFINDFGSNELKELGELCNRLYKMLPYLKGGGGEDV